MSTFVIPGSTNRTTIVGKTGSGKTQAGAFLLSRQQFDKMPWVILDFKREGLFAEIPEIRYIPIDGRGWDILNQPGVFIAQPNIGDEEQVENLLWHIWEHEYCGVFVDEGYMIGKSNAFIACLTQGRSKHIPMIILSQRPAWITKFAFSEADYLMIFQLRLPIDRKTVQEYVEADISRRLPPHHSYWYDVNQDKVVQLRPVPSRDVIINTFKERLIALNTRQRQKTFV
jgi:hypothetical protein